MQSKNAIGNLISRYRAVLKKCNLMNTFGSLAVVGMLVCGASVGGAMAGETIWNGTEDHNGSTSAYTVTNNAVLTVTGTGNAIKNGTGGLTSLTIGDTTTKGTVNITGDVNLGSSTSSANHALSVECINVTNGTLRFTEATTFNVNNFDVTKDHKNKIFVGENGLLDFQKGLTLSADSTSLRTPGTIRTTTLKVADNGDEKDLKIGQGTLLILGDGTNAADVTGDTLSSVGASGNSTIQFGDATHIKGGTVTAALVANGNTSGPGDKKGYIVFDRGDWSVKSLEVTNSHDENEIVIHAGSNVTITQQGNDANTALTNRVEGGIQIDLGAELRVSEANLVTVASDGTFTAVDNLHELNDTTEDENDVTDKVNTLAGNGTVRITDEKEYTLSQLKSIRGAVLSGNLLISAADVTVETKDKFTSTDGSKLEGLVKASNAVGVDLVGESIGLKATDATKAELANYTGADSLVVQHNNALSASFAIGLTNGATLHGANGELFAVYNNTGNAIDESKVTVKVGDGKALNLSNGNGSFGGTVNFEGTNAGTLNIANGNYTLNKITNTTADKGIINIDNGSLKANNVGTSTTNKIAAVNLTNGASATLDTVYATNINVGTAKDGIGGASLTIKNWKSGNVKADPAWGLASSKVALVNGKETGNNTFETAGHVAVAQNAMVSLGNTGNTADQTKWLNDTVAELGNGKGLSKDGYNAALGIYEAIKISDNFGITIDGTSETATAVDGQLQIAKGGLLVINAEKLQQDANNDGTFEINGAAITFDGAVATTLVIDDEATVAVANAKEGKVQIFAGLHGTHGFTNTHSLITTSSMLDIDYGTVSDNTLDADITIKDQSSAVGYEKINSSLYGVLSQYHKSKAVNGFISAAENLTDVKQGKAIEGGAKISIAGAVVPIAGDIANASAGVVGTRTSIANAGTDAIAAINIDGDDTQLVAVADGASESGMNNGFGLWAMPMYKHSNADGFKSGNYKYGYKSDFSGIAVGTDYTIDNAFRLGAQFNAGSGSSDSQGDFDSTKNDFDFWGLGLYAGYQINNFGLSADFGYTSINNEIEQNSTAGQLSADLDAYNITAGIKGEYSFATELVDIVPHVGVRLNHTSVDSYNSKFAGSTALSSDSMDATTVSFPAGVTLSKDIETSDWTVSPSLDLSVISTTGDTDQDIKVRIPGVAGAASMNSEIIDPVTFQSTLGVDAKNGNFSFGLDYTLDLSQNVTSHGVQGVIRYEF